MDLVLLKVSRTACCSIEPGLINPSAVMTAIIKKCERVSECVHCNDGRVHVFCLNAQEWGRKKEKQKKREERKTTTPLCVDLEPEPTRQKE